MQSVQIIFNMFRQRPAELLFRESARRGSASSRGCRSRRALLTGKLTAQSAFARRRPSRASTATARRFDRGETFSGLDYAIGLAAVEALRALVPAGMTLAQMALAWIQMHDAVTCSIPGAKRVAQVAENMAAADMPPLDPATMKAIAAIYERYAKEHVHGRW